MERVRILGVLLKPEYSGFPIEIRNHSKVQFYQQGLHFSYHPQNRLCSRCSSLYYSNVIAYKTACVMQVKRFVRRRIF